MKDKREESSALMGLKSTLKRFLFLMCSCYWWHHTLCPYQQKNIFIFSLSNFISITLARFLALVTTMVTMVDHGNHRTNDRGNDRSNHRGYYDRYYNVNA